MISQDHSPYLTNLIHLGHPAVLLKVDPFLNSPQTEDMVTPLHALLKPQGSEKRTELHESNIRIGTTSEQPPQQLFVTPHRFIVPEGSR